MPYLSYITDTDFEAIVRHILSIGFQRKQSVQVEFEKNVIDPFATIFDAAVSGFNHQTWKESEMVRQCQKTLTNHIGNMHQKILGSVKGWEDMTVGGEVDLRSTSKKIIAEVKNKYNTLTGGRLADEYNSLSDKVTKKSSTYYGFTAYFVNIIPKTPTRFDIPFVPSDRSIGSKVPAHEMVRMIDGASFYHLVTGEYDALKNFYNALPLVIEKIIKNEFGMPEFVIEDKHLFALYFNKAFG
ncbi:Eco47II family restriction endonuclease [Alishewanella sp. d11]|uniref:Eco47II family restriction endonuclease n=1 Tax=Alishewanella sp. d11 TaxID=3414030 RepID=UPI003BF7C0F6